MKVRKIIIMGPQGCGKGTQAKKLAAEFGLIHISTGKILRWMRDNDEGLSDETKRYLREDLEKGVLASDDVINEIVKKRLERDDVKESGFILDGYPRTVEQAEFLNSVCDVNDAVLVNISDDESVRRIGGRVVSKKDGKIYHLKYDPPPEGKEVYVREDDKEEVIRKRLKTYHDTTEPILDIYRERRVLREVGGEQSIDGVYSDVKKALRLD